MIKKTPAEVRMAAVVKAYRSAIRLKHMIAADDEVNATVPAIEQRMKAMADKELLVLNPGEAFLSDEEAVRLELTMARSNAI
jgi:hypothetical protein